MKQKLCECDSNWVVDEVKKERKGYSVVEGGKLGMYLEYRFQRLGRCTEGTPS